MTREKAYEIIDRCPICTECDASFPYNCDECREAFLTAFDALKQPEIIRCKDCKNWIPGTITDHDDFIPPECGKYRQMVGHHSEDYCSLAESN